jgi:hypothetical protein
MADGGKFGGKKRERAEGEGKINKYIKIMLIFINNRRRVDGTD